MDLSLGLKLALDLEDIYLNLSKRRVREGPSIRVRYEFDNVRMSLLRSGQLIRDQ